MFDRCLDLVQSLDQSYFKLHLLLHIAESPEKNWKYFTEYCVLDETIGHPDLDIIWFSITSYIFIKIFLAYCLHFLHFSIKWKGSEAAMMHWIQINHHGRNRLLQLKRFGWEIKITTRLYKVGPRYLYMTIFSRRILKALGYGLLT